MRRRDDGKIVTGGVLQTGDIEIVMAVKGDLTGVALFVGSGQITAPLDNKIDDQRCVFIVCAERERKKPDFATDRQTLQGAIHRHYFTGYGFFIDQPSVRCFSHNLFSAVYSACLQRLLRRCPFRQHVFDLIRHFIPGLPSFISIDQQLIIICFFVTNVRSHRQIYRFCIQLLCCR